MAARSILFAIAGGIGLALSLDPAARAATTAKPPHAIRLENTKLGEVYETAAGMTVYEFKMDVPHSHKSACNGECATLWPPVAAPAGFKPRGAWGMASRTGGETQLTYQGYPLYTWIKDKKPGDITGQGVRGIWRVAKPGQAQVSWAANP